MLSNSVCDLFTTLPCGKEKFMNETVLAILSGGVFVAVIEGVREYLSWRRSRKAVKEDRAEDEKLRSQTVAVKKIKDLEDKVNALVESQKYILYDRIRFLGQSYIEEQEIDFDDRRILNDMHHSYHFGLEGNGDLDTLMEEVNHLPLKIKR